MTSPRELKRLERNFDALVESLRQEVGQGDLTPEKARERRQQADASALEFCKIYYPQIFSAPYSELHRYIADLTFGKHFISGFRRSGKTAFTLVDKMIRSTCLGIGGVVNYSARTLLKAQSRVRSVIRLMMRNPLLVYDYDLELEEHAGDNYLMRAGEARTMIVATSRGVGLRSITSDDFTRCRISIGDDLYDAESVRSEADNLWIKDFVEDEMWGQLEDDGLCIILGNMISEGCPIALLAKDHPEMHYSFPIRDEEGKPTWPELFDSEKIQQMERETPITIWEGQYMERPILIGEIFQPDWIRFQRVKPDQILASVTIVDPAFGTSPSACWKAAVTLAALKGGRENVIDLYLRREPYPDLFDYLFALRGRITGHHKVILFENDFQQFQLAKPYYERWKESSKHELPLLVFVSKQLKSEHFGTDKESRIMNLAFPHQTGTLTYDPDLEGTEDFKRHRTQLISFGRLKEKLDGPDALASAHILLPRWLSQGTFEPSGKRKHPQPRMGGWFT